MCIRKPEWIAARKRELLEKWEHDVDSGPACLADFDGCETAAFDSIEDAAEYWASIEAVLLGVPPAQGDFDDFAYELQTEELRHIPPFRFEMNPELLETAVRLEMDDPVTLLQLRAIDPAKFSADERVKLASLKERFELGSELLLERLHELLTPPPAFPEK